MKDGEASEREGKFLTHRKNCIYKAEATSFLDQPTRHPLRQSSTVFSKPEVELLDSLMRNHDALKRAGEKCRQEGTAKDTTCLHF